MQLMVLPLMGCPGRVTVVGWLGWMSWLTSITFTIQGRGFSVSEGRGCWEVGVMFGEVG